jgi:hypothetical protein
MRRQNTQIAHALNPSITPMVIVNKSSPVPPDLMRGESRSGEVLLVLVRIVLYVSGDTVVIVWVVLVWDVLVWISLV